MPKIGTVSWPLARSIWTNSSGSDEKKPPPPARDETLMHGPGRHPSRSWGRNPNPILGIPCGDTTRIRTARKQLQLNLERRGGQGRRHHPTHSTDTANGHLA